MVFDLQLEQAKYVQGILHAEDLPRVAADALEAGYDSRSLRILAGFQKPTAWDAEPVWFKALEELGERRLNREETLLPVADWVIRRSETGDITTKVAASILCKLCWQNQYDGRLMDIYMVNEYVDIGQTREAELAEAFERFKRRDFPRRKFSNEKT